MEARAEAHSPAVEEDTQAEVVGKANNPAGICDRMGRDEFLLDTDCMGHRRSMRAQRLAQRSEPQRGPSWKQSPIPS